MRLPLAICMLTFLVTMGDLAQADAQGKKGAGNNAASSSGVAAQSAPQGASSSAALESEMLAYGGLRHIAKSVAATVCAAKGVDNDNSVIVIYDQTAFGTVQSYEAFVANLQVVSSAYKTLIPGNDLQADLQGLFKQQASDLQTMATNETDPDRKRSDQHKATVLSIGLSSTIDPFSDATSLLSAIAISANTESPGQITIPDSAMAVALTRELKADCSKNITVVYPPLFGKGSSTDFASADVQLAIQKLDDIRVSAQNAVSKANASYISKYPKQTTTTTAATKGKATFDQTVDTTVSQTGFAPVAGDPVLTAGLTDINGLYDNFMNSLLQVNSSTGVIGSASVIQGYQIASLLKGTQCDDSQKDAAGLCPVPNPAPADPYSVWKQRPAFVLLASVASAAGTELDHKTIWTALWSGDRITYSGGAVVNVSLWVADSATPIYADVLRYRAPFLNVKPPADVTGDDSGDNLK